MGECYRVPSCRPHNPHEWEPLRSSPRAILARVTGAWAPGESWTPPGLPTDGAGSSTPLASATVALIKRTICLPLNQTQIPFPSNVPEASRDSGGPSLLGSVSCPRAQALLPPPPLPWLGSGECRRREGVGDWNQGGKPGDLTVCWALRTRLPGGACALRSPPPPDTGTPPQRV